MPSTYLSLNAHIVFATKRRDLLLNRESLEQTHAYVGGIIRKLGVVPVQIGGIEDHIHLLVGLKANHCIADIVREVKKRSTLWIREANPDFEWQIGYAALSVSPERMAGVIKYIANQREHHHTMSFEEEREMLLKMAGLEYHAEEQE